MKKLLILIMAIVFLAGCATVDPRVTVLEEKVAKLEKRIVMGQASGAGASIYPVTANLIGGGTGALDKITSVADGDAALAILSENATWGDAFIPYTADDNSATEAIPYVVDPDEAGALRWHMMDVYGKKLYGHIPVVTTPDSCTIGSDCDGALVRVAWGGIITSTADANAVTLPEIVAATPTAVQVVPGASLCVINIDASEHFHLVPNAADSITDEVGAKNAAGHYIATTLAATSAGDFICVVATAADNWQVMGYRGTLVKE